MADSPEVILRDERHGAGRRWLAVRRDAQGDLLIEGQDLGSTVSQLSATASTSRRGPSPRPTCRCW